MCYIVVNVSLLYYNNNNNNNNNNNVFILDRRPYTIYKCLKYIL